MLDIATPRGRRAHFHTRPETSDGALVAGIIGADEYGLGRLPRLTGWAIDIGAHIGTVAISLALDNPHLRIVAVEALPENIDSLRANVAANRLGDRIYVEHAAASSETEFATGGQIDITYGWSRADGQPDSYMADNRFIGGMVAANETSQTTACSPLSLAGIMANHDIDRVTLLKIDCEGCEWFFLDSPDIGKIDLILGEMHVGRHGDAKRLREMLEPTHDVEMDDRLVVAHFTARRR